MIKIYETIRGERITGTITTRYERTMVVENEQGRHLCKLVGEPVKHKPQRFIKTYKGPSKHRTPIRVIEPNGTIRDFQSIKYAAEYADVGRAVVKRAIESGNPVYRGKAKGYQFQHVTEV